MYIGVRSCDCEIADDIYFGSPFHLPDELKDTGVKTVLSVHDTREKAALKEINLHKLLDVRNNKMYINQCNATSTKFYCSKEAHLRSAETRRGRTKESHKYIEQQVIARANYKGKGLTKAQKAQWDESRKEERMAKYNATFSKTMENPDRAKTILEARVRGGKSCTGIKNPSKGSTGTKHPRYFEWWYINPKQEKIIVKDSVRNYCNNNDCFPVSSASVMRFLRDNKVPDRLKSLGWNFGKVNSKE
jgi:hypothetical protein